MCIRDRCGTDENGSYIELRKPRGETPPCFIDEFGVVHDTIRIYEYKAVRSKEISTDSRCVMCGAIIPEGSMAVSYTHLDVYKRQLIRIVCTGCMGRMMPERGLGWLLS